MQIWKWAHERKNLPSSRVPPNPSLRSWGNFLFLERFYCSCFKYWSFSSGVFLKIKSLKKTRKKKQEGIYVTINQLTKLIYCDHQMKICLPHDLRYKDRAHILSDNSAILIILLLICLSDNPKLTKKHKNGTQKIRCGARHACSQYCINGEVREGWRKKAFGCVKGLYLN